MDDKVLLKALWADLQHFYDSDEDDDLELDVSQEQLDALKRAIKNID